MKPCRLLVLIVFYVACCCAAVCQTQPRTPLFGGEVTRDTADHPLLAFTYGKKGKEFSGGEAWLVWFEGGPALEILASNQHWGSSSTAQGRLLICKDRAVFDVTDGVGARGHAKALPQDDIEVPISGMTFKYHDGWGPPTLMVILNNGREKRGISLWGASRPFYEFLGEVTRNFDGVVREIAQAANLKDIDRDLPESAHYHRTGVDELNTKVAQEREEEKEEKASQGGGGGLSALLAIATGAAAGVSGASSNTPILQTANQQATAIRAIGDANAAKQQAASQQQALAAQQRIAAQQAAAANNVATSSTSHTPPTAQGPQQDGSENAAGSQNQGGSCNSMNSSVSVTYQWRTGSGGFCTPEVLSFVTNNSSQNVDCALAFHKNGSFDTANASQVTVRPGQTAGGEWGGLWSCGNDTNQVIYSCTSTAQNQSNNCLGRVNWTIQ